VRSSPRRIHQNGALRSALPTLALLVALPACGPDVQTEAPPSQTHDLGSVDFPTSCPDAVQADLERGVALLHHMTYVEARSTFREAAEQEPDCAMAHWGMAMSHFQPFWGEHDIEAGRPAADRAVELEAPTERERQYAAAVHAYYAAPDASRMERVRSWEQAMEELHRAFPDDQEAAAFFALAHLSTAPADREVQARTSRILEEILSESPEHPGAIHYAIHAHDVDARADAGVTYADAYGDIAPSNPHALHMPSHIYVRVAEWDEVIDWNRRSADAALELPADDGLSLHYSHALDYLMYGYLQRGRDDLAEAVLRELREGERHQPAFATAYALASVPARWHVERRDWAGARELEPRVPATFPWDDFPESEAISHYARGLGAARTGDLDQARASMDRLEELEDAAREAWGDEYWARQIQVKQDAIAAWAALAEGRTGEAVEVMTEAAELHDEMEKSGVTPGDLQPAQELLGDLLMEVDRPAEALEAFERSLEKWPGRYHTILGAARAAYALGEEDDAQAYYTQLLELTAGAQTDREGVAEALERGAVDPGELQ
jgi:tetratricopeptide (TPR) repeat protein